MWSCVKLWWRAAPSSGQGREAKPFSFCQVLGGFSHFIPNWLPLLSLSSGSQLSAPCPGVYFMFLVCTDRCLMAKKTLRSSIETALNNWTVLWRDKRRTLLNFRQKWRNLKKGTGVCRQHSTVHTSKKAIKPSHCGSFFCNACEIFKCNKVTFQVAVGI